MNIFPFDGALEEARMYMRIAGYDDFTKRDLRNLTRVMKGYLPADQYASEIVSKYLNVHGRPGDKTPAIVPNKLRTCDMAILETAERKIFPARLIWEFRFGPQVGFYADDLMELNRRLCGDLYCSAGELNSGISYEELGQFLSDFCRDMKSAGRDVYDICPLFQSLLCRLLEMNLFESGGMFTCMAFVSKIAYFWGFTMRFEDSGLDDIISFTLSDRIVSQKGCVRVA